ncbi:hypothetical protein BRC81_14580 [Halobacteriales archaeon QS_1_68_20]|nr:MAG: hypothetical protein BRC81_14580 [Halobacteriales archaeon QS_1_68_20]
MTAQAQTALHVGTGPLEEVAIHVTVGAFRVGLGALLALAVVYLLDRPDAAKLSAVWRYARGRIRAHPVSFVGTAAVVAGGYAALGAYWSTYFYGRVDWVSVLGSGTASRLPLFLVFAAYVAVLRETFDGLAPDREAALGTTGGAASFAAVLLACPSCVVALALLLASAGLVGASTLSLLRYLNPVQSYAGYFAILGTTLMVLGVYVLSNGRCRVPGATTDDAATQ